MTINKVQMEEDFHKWLKNQIIIFPIREDFSKEVLKKVSELKERKIPLVEKT